MFINIKTRPVSRRKRIDRHNERQAMKIVIPGGSGQVGTVLARAFHAGGDDVVVLSRRPEVRPWRVVAWQAATLDGWQREIDGCDVVINLAGRSVNCRYSRKNREEILRSRLDSTRVVGEAIAQSARPPRLWLQASTATIYAHRYDAANDEYTGVIGGAEPYAPDTWRFSIDVARAWEAEFERTVTPNTRKIALRSAMTMSPDRGGIFDTLAILARRGLGGRAAGGRQFISWIHEHDFTAAIRLLIDRDDITGIINIAAPNPLPQQEFMRVLRKECGAIAGLPASRWMLEVGAWLMRTETELILKSRRVVPARLLDHGFAFRFADWGDAAQDLCGRWRRGGILPTM
jgi:uncharacterized protein (TIGR01777 family)